MMIKKSIVVSFMLFSIINCDTISTGISQKTCKEIFLDISNTHKDGKLQPLILDENRFFDKDNNRLYSNLEKFKCENHIESKGIFQIEEDNFNFKFEFNGKYSLLVFQNEQFARDEKQILDAELEKPSYGSYNLNLIHKNSVFKIHYYLNLNTSYEEDYALYKYLVKKGFKDHFDYKDNLYKKVYKIATTSDTIIPVIKKHINME